MVVASLRRRLLLSTTMLVGALAGYGRGAYAACTTTDNVNYVCEDPSLPQVINANNATVTTGPNFSVDTSPGIALFISGSGDLSFTDVNQAYLVTGVRRRLP